MRDWSKISFTACIAILSVLTIMILVAPSIIIFITSFTDSYSLKFPPEGWSLRWYKEVFDSPQLISAAITSFKVAAISAVICVVLGVPAAMHIATSQSAWAKALDSLFMAPLVLPALAFGLALVMVVTTLGFELSIYWLIAGHVIVSIPFVLRTTIASLAKIDPAWLESSASLGASKLYTFRRITVPSIRSGVLAGMFLAFMWSFDNIPVSLFVADARTEVLPIRLWQIIQASLDVRAAAASGILIVFTIILMVIFEKTVGLSKHLK